MLSTLRLQKRRMWTVEFNASTSGNSTSNQFLNTQQSSSAPTTTETGAQTPAGARFSLRRLAAGFIVAATRQATVTARINGVSQASTATVIGTATTQVVTDLTSSILTLATDQLSAMFVTAIADAGTTRPRCALVGSLSDVF